MYEEFHLRQTVHPSEKIRYWIDLNDSASVSFVDLATAEYLVGLLNKYFSSGPFLALALDSVEGFLRWSSERAASNRKDLNHATQAR